MQPTPTPCITDSRATCSSSNSPLRTRTLWVQSQINKSTDAARQQSHPLHLSGDLNADFSPTPSPWDLATWAEANGWDNSLLHLDNPADTNPPYNPPGPLDMGPPTILTSPRRPVTATKTPPPGALTTFSSTGHTTSQSQTTPSPPTTTSPPSQTTDFTGSHS
jgi:hypothetical protein